MDRESQIFNRMLGIAGLAFSEGIEIDHPFAPTARNLIQTVRQQMALGDDRSQRMGWWFNTDTITFYRSGDEILLPDNILRLDVIEPVMHKGAIRRGNRLFNKVLQSFTFEEDVTCLVTLDLDLDDTPVAFQALVEAECCRRFAISPLSAMGQAQAFQQEAAVAQAQLIQEDNSQKPANVIEDGDWNTRIIGRCCNARRRR